MNVPVLLILPSRSRKQREQSVLSPACQMLGFRESGVALTQFVLLPGFQVSLLTLLCRWTPTVRPLYLGLFISLEFEETKQNHTQKALK